MSGIKLFGNASCVIAIYVSLLIGSSVSAEQPAVRFDVPALLGVHELQFADGHFDSESNSQKIIEVVIPVSTEIALSDRGNVDEFRFDIYWNRNVYPLVEYGPKTRTTSEIEGLITVEKSQESNAGIGLNLSSPFPEVISGTAKAELSNRGGTKLKYEKVPQHEVLVASGTIQRGTGAFFRFHPSKRETLEGGRDLIVAFRVPQSWRGGVIKIECRASGHRRIVGSWREPFEENRAFVLPIYLEGDDQARRAAEDFVRSEQGLRRQWQSHSGQPVTTNGLFSFVTRQSASPVLPADWVHHLIQSGRDDYLERYRSRLSDDLMAAANDFVVARQDLFRMSR